MTLGAVAIDALRQRLKKAESKGMMPDEIPLVFPNTVGKLLRPKEFDRQTWYEIRSTAGIPGTFNSYDLRHTQASLRLQPASP